MKLLAVLICAAVVAAIAADKTSDQAQKIAEAIVKVAGKHGSLAKKNALKGVANAVHVAAAKAHQKPFKTVADAVHVAAAKAHQKSVPHPAAEKLVGKHLPKRAKPMSPRHFPVRRGPIPMKAVGAPIGSGPLCSMCDLLLAKFLTNATLQTFMTEMEQKVCADVAAADQQQCHAMFQQYRAQIIQYLLTTPPSQLCATLNMCSNSMSQTFKGNMKSWADCDGCKVGVAALQGMLGSQTVQKSLEDLIVNGVCPALGSNAAMCKGFVQNYFSAILNALAATLNVQLLCVDTGVCPQA